MWDSRPTSMSLKSIPWGGRAIRTRRPSCCHRNAQFRAAASPGPSPSARTITSRTSFGRSSARSPDVESAAYAGWPVAFMAARQVLLSITAGMATDEHLSAVRITDRQARCLVIMGRTARRPTTACLASAEGLGNGFSGHGASPRRQRRRLSRYRSRGCDRRCADCAPPTRGLLSDRPATSGPIDRAAHAARRR